MSENAKTPKAPSKMQRIVDFLNANKDTAHEATAIEAAANSAPSTRTMLHHLTMAGRVWRPSPGLYQSVLGLSDECLKEIVAAAQAQAKQRGAGMKRGAAELAPPTVEETPKHEPADQEPAAEQPEPEVDPAPEVPEVAEVPEADVGEPTAPEAVAVTENEPEKPATLADVLLIALRMLENASPSELVKFLRTQPESEGLNISESTVRKALEKLVKKGQIKKGSQGYRVVQ